MSLEVEVFPEIKTTLNFDLESLTDELKVVSSKEEKGKTRARAESEKYVVNIVKQSEAKDAYLSFSVKRKDGSKFKVKGYGVDCVIPIMDFEDVFTPHNPAGGGAFMGTHQRFEWYASACMYMPFVICANRYGVNRFSLGFRDQVLETEMNGGMNGSGTQDYLVRLKRPVKNVVLTRTELEDGLLFSTRENSWFDVVEDYCGKVDRLTNYRPLPIPDAYYEPQWNSWIPFYLNIDQDGIWEYAKICKELGIKLVSIDAGWESARSDSWDEFGDWVPKPKKFPDMKGLISKIQKELGLLVELFVGPFYVGPASDVYKKLKEIRIRTELGESSSLCPRNPLTKKHVVEVVGRVAKELSPDFILVDLTVSIPPHSCIAQHDHIYESMGEGYNECVKAIVEAVKEANPKTLIESCDTTNLNNKQFWPMTFDSVGGEVGLDFSLHQRQMVLTRSFSRGLVVKNTPLPWHMQASDEEFGKHMMQQAILGVPSIVVDLKKLSQSHAKILKAWLNFYRKNRKELSTGEFRPIGFYGATFPHVKIEGDQNVFIQIGSTGIPPIVLKKKFVRAYIMNSAESENLHLVLEGLKKGEFRVKILNCFLDLVREKKLSYDEKCCIDINVPKGGLVYLEKA